MRTHAQMHEDIGRAEERKTLLQKMLETFFGPLPIEAQQRIDEATPEQLESWVKSLGAVLKPNGASIDDVLNGTGR